MPPVINIKAVGWPVRITVRRHYGDNSVAETFDIPRWSELHIAIIADQSVQLENVTSEGWQNQPNPASAPTPA